MGDGKKSAGRRPEKARLPTVDSLLSVKRHGAKR